jgi:hypothetical protein
LAERVQVRVDWDHTAIPLPLPGFKILRIGPEPGYPYGRKGLALAGAWRQLSTPTADGMLLLDGDVAIDLLDLAAMVGSVSRETQDVHTAAVRLWPAGMASGHSWVWAHWEDEPSQHSDLNPRRFSFCFTWLPRRLIDAAVKAGLEQWTYPDVDRQVSLLARRLAIQVHVVPGCTPKHLHF